MASNGTTLVDEEGDTPDWIELFNPGPSEFDLSGYGLSDDASRPFRWVFTNAVIAARSFLVVYASGKNRQPEPLPPVEPVGVPGLRVRLDAGLVNTNDALQVRRFGELTFVRRWNDTSGGGNHAAQANDSNQPLWIPSAVNGRPAVRFDGANDLLLLPRPVGTNHFCLFAVLRTSQMHETDPESNSGVGGVSGQHYLFGARHGGDVNAGAGVSVGTNGVSVYEHGSGYMPALAVYKGELSSGPTILTVNYDAKQPAIDLRALVVRTGVRSPRGQVTAPMEIGSGAYGAFGGDVAEVLLYNRALTEIERRGVAHYLAAKYGIALPLPRHTSFELSADGEELVLTRPNGTIADYVEFGGMPRDVSYGRQADAVGKFLFFAQPTPGGSNTTPGSVEFLMTPTFSHEGGFYSNAFALTIASGNAGAEIRYTLDGSEPGEASTPYTGPLSLRSRSGTPNDISNIPTVPGGPTPLGEVFKAWVVRARAFKPGALPSATRTRTFWIDARGRGRYTLPVLALATDRANLFDNTLGIYVPGNAPGANYSQRGPEWERPVHVEFVETDNRLALAQDADVKIHGNTSQNFPIKGLDLDGTGGTGQQPFRHRIFPDRARTEFDHFLLRPTGHDQQMAFMRDELMQSLSAETGAEFQAARACVVFINGEYWGLHYLKEKEDADFVAWYGGVAADNLDFLEGYAAARAGDVQHYQAMINYFSTHDLREPETYAHVATQMEVTNYIDYKACEIFYYRWDIGNHRLWRPRTPEGRWRWLQFDNDVGWGGFWAEQPAWQFNMLAADLTPNGSLHDHNNETTTFLLRRLMLNASFKRDFINRCADLLNTLFLPSHSLARIGQMAAVLEPEMAEHTRRWRAPASLTDWRNRVQYLRDYANNRPQFMRQHLIQQFGLGGTATLAIAVSDTNQGSVRLNTLTIVAPTNAPWSGTYFTGNPINVTAVANPGYHFGGWQGILGVTTNTVALLLNGDLGLTALFAPDPTTAPQFTSVGRLPEGAIRLSIEGRAGQSYQLQSSADLGYWSNLQLLETGTDGKAAADLNGPADSTRGFYRLRSP